MHEPDRAAGSHGLVGRTAETGTLRGVIEQALGGRGCSVVLAGPPGIGKSRLAEETAQIAVRRGLRMFRGGARPTAGRVPFDVLAGALLQVTRGLSGPQLRSLGGFLPHLGRIIPGLPGADIPADVSPLLVGEAALRLLRLAEPSRASCLILEDLHWADPDSVTAIEYMLGAIEGEPMSLLVTVRSDGTDLDSMLVDRLAARTRCTIVVPPLTRSELAVLGTDILGGGSLPIALLDHVWSRSEGNPLIAEELIGELVRSGAIEAFASQWSDAGRWTSRVPASVSSSVRRRVRAFPTSQRRVIEAASLLGRTFEWSLLSTIAQVDDESCSAALEAAVQMGLLRVDGGEFRFRHVLTRDAVVEQMHPPTRARLAAQALEAVEEAHPNLAGDWGALAAELAELSGQIPRACGLLLRVSDQAMARGAVALAQATLRHAQSLTTVEHQLAIERALVDCLVLSGDPLRAVEVGRSLDTAPVQMAVDERISLRLQVARAAIAAGDPLQALSLARASTQLLQDRVQLMDQPRFTVQGRTVEAHALYELGRTSHAEKLARANLRSAGELGLDRERFESLLLLGRLEPDASVQATLLDDALELAAEAGQGSWRLRALQERAAVAIVLGDTEYVLAARHEIDDAGAALLAASLDLIMADLGLVMMDAVATRAAAMRCIGTSERFSLAARPIAHLWVAGAAALEGRTTEMEESLARAHELAPEDPRIAADEWGRVRSTLALVRGDIEAFSQALDRSMEFVRQPVVSSSVFFGRVLRAVVHASHRPDRGAAARADALESEVLLGVPVARTLIGWSEAVSLGRVGRSEEANAAFDDARLRLSPRCAEWGLVHAARMFVAEAAVRDGWGTPVEWLRASEAYFVHHGYAVLARRCRFLLRQSGAAPSRRGRGRSTVPERLRALSITSREMDVLLLVAENLTTRQIADRLSLSPRTVEYHVANLFSRTGTHRRDQLVRLIGEHLGAPPAELVQFLRGDSE